jgi:phage/plasmid-associated DNA primase
VSKLALELPGIIGWAAIGARRLVEARGKFTHVQESVDSLIEYRVQQNPVEDFIAECFIREPDAQTSFQDFCAAFDDWWDGDPRDKRRTIWSISYALRSMNFTTARIRKTDDTDNKFRIIRGIKAKSGRI